MRPIRIIGIVAILVFGMIFLMQFVGKEQDLTELPGDIPLGTGEGNPEPEIPQGDSVLAEPLLIGSGDARDDLYCSGLLFAAHQASGDVFSDEAQRQRDRVIALSDAGVAKLIAEGVANASQTGAIANAHADLAAADLAAGMPRISIEECEVRGTKLIQN